MAIEDVTPERTVCAGWCGQCWFCALLSKHGAGGYYRTRRALDGHPDASRAVELGVHDAGLTLPAGGDEELSQLALSP